MKTKIFTTNILLLLVIAFLSCVTDESTSSCTDGILNGTETGVDCGGDCGDCELQLESIYTGSLKVTKDNDPSFILYQSNDAQLSVQSCSSNCLDFTFITDAGSTQATGVYVKNQGFYSLDITPAYEIPGNPQPWEENWNNGNGTFNYVNGEMIISVIVDDEHSVGGTDSFYFFDGSQN